MKLLQYLEQDPKDPAPSFLGLSQAEADRRLKEEGKNVLQNGKKIRPAVIFVSQFKDFLTLILLVSTAVTLFLGDYTEALTIGVIVLCNGLMGFFRNTKRSALWKPCGKWQPPRQGSTGTAF